MSKRTPRQLASWLSVVGALAIAYSTPCPAHAADLIYVDANVSGGNSNGTSWANAYRFLQDALDKSPSSEDVIRVAAGIYKPDQDEEGDGDPNSATPGDRASTFVLVDGVTIQGGYRGGSVGGGDPNQWDSSLYMSVLSGDLLGNDRPWCDPNSAPPYPFSDNSYHVVSADGDITTAAVLDGFTITAGYADGSENCDQPGNASGAGLHNDGGSPTVQNCRFIGNQSRCYGAGMANFDATDPSSQPIILNCVFEDNSAAITATTWSTGGGGMYNGDGDEGSSGYGSDPTVENCLFVNNKAGHDGGSTGAHLHEGAGICNHNSNPNVVNCIFTGNIAMDAGGAIANRFGSSPTITNCTIVYNQAGDGGPNRYGGGIHNENNPNDAPTVTNCILWGNTDDGSGESSQIYGGNPTVTYTCIDDCADPGFCSDASNIDDDPDFLAPNHADYYLQYDSPCIDTGDNTPPGGLPSDDFDGNDRTVDAGGGEIVDMGAYEYAPDTARIYAEPNELTFVAAYEGYYLPPDQTLHVSNPGEETLHWSIEEECPWLEVDPSSGDVTTQVDEVTLSVSDVSGLAPGRHACWLKVVDEDASNHSYQIRVILCMPQVYYVDHDYPENNCETADGSPTKPYCTIQEAIDAIEDDLESDCYCGSTGSTVLVADGTYTGEGNTNIEFHGMDIIVRSVNGPNDCIIDCEEENNTRAFRIRESETSDALIEGFTIQNGNYDFGGGIRCEDTYPRIRNCIFANNVADDKGGGLFYQLPNGASANLVNCEFNGNQTESDAEYDGGGGVYCMATSGHSTSIAIPTCTFDGNFSADRGGGLLVYRPLVAMTNCKFIDNEADSTANDGKGGGVWMRYSDDTTITNCSFAGNTASSDSGCYGGAMYFRDCTTTVSVITNCIAWGNVPTQDQIETHLTQAEPQVYYCDVQDRDWGAGNDNISTDPEFVNLGAGDLRLMSDSPCIDAGDDTAVPEDEFDVDGDGDEEERTPDLDFNDRVQHCEVDMGAYEIEECASDLDWDGDVDLADLAELLGSYGETSGMTYWDGDLDCDGDVDLSDLADLLGEYGSDCGRDSEGGGGGGGEGEDGSEVDVSVVAYDTKGYSGGGFEGEVDHFVFDLKIEVNDPNDDDWVATGAKLGRYNDAAFRLSTTATTPDQYATFVAAPWTSVPGSATANLAGAYDPPHPTGKFITTGINLGWFDCAASHDGPAAVMRIVIDVSEVDGADVSAGFGSVYFGAKIGRDDIQVADLTSGTFTAESAPNVESLSGSFWVTAE